MKISNNGSGPLSNPATDTAKTSKAGSAESLLDTKKTKSIESSGPNGAARVEVSTRAQEMAKAKELATPSNDVDEAKVSRLQAMIDSGKYKIDSSAIADRLLDEHTKMS